MRSLNSQVAAVALLSLLLCFCACKRDGGTTSTSNQGNGKAQTFADAQSAAAQSLTTFRQLVNEKNYKELGFESLEEVSTATLGNPIPVVFVRLDSLRQYQAGSDPNALLSSSNQMSYPVMARDQVRTSVVVEQVDGKWQTATLGNGALAKALAAVRKPAAAGSAGNQESLVHVGALGLYFLAQRADNKWTLTPLTDKPDMNLKAGAAMPAEEVLGRLTVMAKQLSDDAPM
ncbi:MAG: hypothetical protein ABJA18_11855 [bacterium]